MKEKIDKIKINKIIEAKSKLSEKLNELQENLQDNEKKDIQAINNRLSRIVEEAEKGLYFLTIQGSLKTGKSTLTNLFVGSDIAITKAGQDTTKTPYVITKSPDNEDRIIIYETVESYSKEDEKNILEAIIDEVKGIGSDNEYKKYFSAKVKNFERSVIEKYTVEEGNTNVLFINIQVTKPKNVESWLLDEDIAILDTPGVEGLKAHKNFALIKEIENRTNMVIAMQSTITPINKVEIDVLKKYKYQSAEIRLMHNKFVLKDWVSGLAKEKLEEQDSTSLKKTKELLREELKSEFPSKNFNLAKVEDYKKDNKTYAGLKDEYNSFIEFVNELKKNIKNKKHQDKELQAREKFIKYLNAISIDVDAEQVSMIQQNQKDAGILKNLQKEYEDRIEKLNKNKEDIGRYFEEYRESLGSFVKVFRDKYESDLEHAIATIASNSSKKLQGSQKYQFQSDKIDIPLFRTGKIEQKLNLFSEEVKKDVNEKLKRKAHDYILKILKEYEEGKNTDESSRSVENEEKRVDSLKEIEDKLKKTKLFALPDLSFKKLKIDKSDLPDILIDQISIKLSEIKSNDDLTIKRKLGKDLNIPKVEEYIKKLVQESVNAQKEKFIKQLESNIENRVGEYTETLMEKKDELLEKLKKYNQDRTEKYQKAMDVLHQLRIEIKNILEGL